MVTLIVNINMITPLCTNLDPGSIAPYLKREFGD
jgi:hypothetical protein